MPEPEPPTHAPRLSLTKRQLETPAAVDLLQLLQSVTADGRLLDREIQALRDWLHVNRDEDLPALSHLREAIDRVLGDGVITPAERLWLQQQIEAVLPVEFRSDAKQQRQLATKEQMKAAAAQAQAEAARNAPAGELDFMVAGCGYDGRPHIINTAVRDGIRVLLTREHGNAYSPNATLVCLTSGRNIGYVPEDLARELAPLLDAGVRQAMRVKKVLRGRRNPVPVVCGDLYLPTATAGVVVPAVSAAAVRATIRPVVTVVVILAVLAFFGFLIAMLTR